MRESLCSLLSKKNGYQDIIKKYDGKVVGESGILAAAHLGGAGSVKRYFKNNGEKYIGCYGLQYGV
jgi:hypothetical protein